MGVVCPHGLYAELPEERHWPGQTSESMTTTVALSASGPDPSLRKKSESKNQPESQSKKLRINSREHFKLGQELSFEK
jgi:hypothetical protein